MRKGRFRQGLLLTATVGFVALHSLVWAAPSGQGRLVGSEPIHAVLMEDHSDAFISWRQAGFKKRTIVHIDSHIDLEWVSGPGLKRLLSSKTVAALKQTRLDPFGRRNDRRSLSPL